MTTAHGELDFETYSEAGFVWNEATRKWQAPQGARSKGLPTVGAAAYTEHPTAEVLTCSYRLPGQPTRRWRPGMPPPADLFAYLEAGGVLEAHNAMFERLVWGNICARKYGWPLLIADPQHPAFYKMRCSMAKARVSSFPGALANLSDVLSLQLKKDKDGKRLLDKFSVPRNPTKADPRTRITPDDDPVDGERLYAYCDRDLDAESEASAAMPSMSADELRFWLIDQEINHRGIGVDRAGIRNCMAVLEQALARYGDEFRALTGGLDPTQLEATRGWLSGRGVHMASMDADALDDALTWPHVTGEARRALEIRQLIGSASVKKLYAMEHQASADDRLRNLIVHHGARTGRPTGEGPQPLNLPREGPKVRWCPSCHRPSRPSASACLWCSAPPRADWSTKWGGRPRDLPDSAPSPVDVALDVMASRSLELVEYYFGDALLTISGCLRGLFCAGPGRELIASDFSAIEAVVIAMLAGEQWRIDAFRERKPIYLLSASKITGVPLEEYLAYKERTGEDHPDRQKIGKVAELANGFGGWIGSNKAFGSTEPDDVIKAQILAWRAASPAIVDLWGGQSRSPPWVETAPREYFGYEGSAIQAIMYPGYVFDWRGVQFFMRETHIGPALIVRLLSGREMTYHQARVMPSQRWPGQLAITYMTWNSNAKMGAFGWVPMETYGGRLTENIVQATAHDILRYAIENLRAAGYPTVLHVYDEIVVEVPAGAGDIAEVERIMATMPPWAADWPIIAAGGWRGVRYRKG